MPRRPFVVNAASILRSGSPRDEHLEGEVHDLFVTGSAVVEGGEAEVDVTLEPLGPTIRADGTVSVEWEAQCRRCLVDVSGRLEAPFTEIFEPEPIPDETWPLDKDRIDLEPIVREAVLLELPQAPLCREACQGLCATCGADLNVTTCSCEPPRDPRWAALDELREPHRTEED